MRRLIVVLIIFMMILSPRLVFAYSKVGNVYYTDGSRADVAAAIADATTDDEINIPEGTFSWTSGVSTGKALVFKGAGTGKTFIEAGSSFSYLFTLSGVFTMQDLEFTLGSTFTSAVLVNNSDPGWVIKGCKFTATGGTTEAVRAVGDSDYFKKYSFGVIANSVFVNTMVSHYYDYGCSTLTDNTGATPVGTANALFVEGCTMTHNVFGHAVDGNCGGRIVFRFNTTTGNYVETHTVQGHNRAMRSSEVYNNHMTGPVVGSGNPPFKILAGSGMLYNNYTTGWSNPSVAMFYARNCTYATGAHDGGDDSDILSDSDSSDLTSIVGYKLYNVTDGSMCNVVSSTTHTITCTLAGGLENKWDNGDIYLLGKETSGLCCGVSTWDGNEAVTEGTGTHDGGDDQTSLTDNGKSWGTNTYQYCTVYNLTKGVNVRGIILSHTNDNVVAVLSDGTNTYDWDDGDSYKITCGYPCRDQQGRGSDDNLWGDPDIPTQADEPYYVWSNLKGSSNLAVGIGNIGCLNTHILVANRDFYDYNTSWTPGTALETGVAANTIANRPTTCTEGVGYWATDENKLYRCGSGNSWSLHYQPYTCPHPAVGSGSCDFSQKGVSGYSLEGGADTTPPTVTAFTLPSTASSLTVPVSSFTCTDAVGVTGYCVTTVASSIGCSWAETAQSSITFASSGAQIAYAWCRDAALNISDSSNDSVTITLPGVVPGAGSQSFTPGIGTQTFTPN